MISPTISPQGSLSTDEAAVRALYREMLDCWNQRDAAKYAALFLEVGSLIGFDGSMLNDPTEIGAELQRIFTEHQTAPYLAIIRWVRFLTPEVAILRAVAGMVPPGESKLNPAVNAVHSLVAIQRDGQWRIALFQNTPAQFHGRLDLSQKLTEELEQLV